MLDNNIQESTTTTGTGDITLGGASENGRTFTSRFNTNERFNYFVDDGSGSWESGIGYLSGTTTLVRETPLDGSAATPISFAAGTKQVFVANSSQLLQPCIPVNNRPSDISASAHFTYQQLSTQNLSADTQYFAPFLFNNMRTPTYLATDILTAGGTGANKFRIGIYTISPDGHASSLIFESADLDPSTTGVKKASLAGLNLKRGWYYVSIVTDVAITIRANNYVYQLEHPMGWTNNRKVSYTQKGNAAWSSMLSDVTSWSATVNNINSPFIGVTYD